MVDPIEEQSEQLETDVAADMLELRAIRNQRTDSTEIRRPGDVATRHALRLPDDTGRTASLDHTQALDITPLVPEVFDAQEFLAAADEGGLVELIAAEAIRQQSPMQSADGELPGSSIFQAEVGIFQTIDVAASLAADPSQAILIPAVFIATFQLFDQRRKLAELDRDGNWN